MIQIQIQNQTKLQQSSQRLGKKLRKKSLDKSGQHYAIGLGGLVARGIWELELGFDTVTWAFACAKVKGKGKTLEKITCIHMYTPL